MKVALEMFFLSLINANIRFIKTKGFTWRNYTASTVLPTTKKVELLDKIKFAAAASNKKVGKFMVYVTALLAASIYLIRKAYVGALIAEKALIKVPADDLKYANVFLPNLAIKLL